MSKIVVVSGDAKLMPVIRNGLRSAGLTAIPIPTAADAWRSLLLDSPSAAIIDARQVAHWEFVTRLRNDGRFHTLPVVVLASSTDEGARVKADTLGVEFLSTPFTSQALIDRVWLAIRTQGPAFGGKIELDQVEVIVLLDRYRVRGFIHLPPEVSRFSDAIEAVMKDNRSFLPLTNASITSTEVNQQLIGHTDLLQVRKEHVRLISPVQANRANKLDDIEVESTVSASTVN